MKPISHPSNLQLVSRIHASRQRRQSRVPGISVYRSYTRALMRRYFRMALDIGRLPSILGGLCFRARISSYPLRTFEDAVIFVHDIERVFHRVERPSLEIIAGVVFLEYSIPEAALRLGITPQRAERRLAAALDALSGVLLEAGLLRPVFGTIDELSSPEHSAEGVLRPRPSARAHPASSPSAAPAAAPQPPRKPPASAFSAEEFGQPPARLFRL